MSNIIKIDWFFYADIDFDMGEAEPAYGIEDDYVSGYTVNSWGGMDSRGNYTPFDEDDPEDVELLQEAKEIEEYKIIDAILESLE